MSIEAQVLKVCKGYMSGAKANDFSLIEKASLAAKQLIAAKGDQLSNKQRSQLKSCHLQALEAVRARKNELSKVLDAKKKNTTRMKAYASVSLRNSDFTV